MIPILLVLIKLPLSALETSMILPSNLHVLRHQTLIIYQINFKKMSKKDSALVKEEIKCLLQGHLWKPYAIKTLGQVHMDLSQCLVKAHILLLESYTAKTNKKLKYLAQEPIR
jgi:hypothetical protein